tara:strand:- start:9660 stop:10520 length:861 start_codon:yes stop_codon:yes gene_type:complete
MIPQSLRDHLHDEHSIEIENEHRISGGDINQSYKISTNRGEFFLKLNTDVPPDFFEKEKEGLNEMRKSDSGLIIPEVIAVGRPKTDQPGFLLLEFIKESTKGNSFHFGAELAKLHKNEGPSFGFSSNNYIGRLPQSNHNHKSWSDFFIQERINPQLKLAVDSGKLSINLKTSADRLAKKLDDLFPPCRPSLLHGDLWGGNYLFNESGQGVLIDPAVYYGHPEMDLAFTHMFGGFSKEFYHGYESITSLEPGFNDRIPIYNLYPLFVHANLFGGHYISQVEHQLKRF